MSIRSYNIYCDESCHLENDGLSVMVLGAVYCEQKEVKRISSKVRAIKAAHGLSPEFEIKWTKVSKSKIGFYEEIIDLFIEEENLRFRGLLIPDKSVLEHHNFDQTHDEWYYKMYYLMLRYIFSPPHHYQVYLDIKDTLGGDKTRKLHDVICNDIYDFEQNCIRKVQQVRSHESEVLQLTDLLIGAIGYFNRGLEGNAGKLQIITKLHTAFGKNILSKSSPFSNTKFNLFVWNSGGASNAAS